MTDGRDLKERWRLAGYPDEMGSATIVPPPTRGFVRGYHLLPANHGISSVSLRRLKVARFSEVNDPFELLALNFREQKTRKLVRRFKAAHNSRTGLLCFSANWTNPVLWSHYANRHEGICLGFDLKSGRVQRVEYEDERLLETLDDNDDPFSMPEALQLRLLRTKSRHWEYEEELRRFINLSDAMTDQGLLFWPFDEDMRLVEVILGPQSPLEVSHTRELVLATNPGVTVFRARLAFRSFQVVVDGKSVVKN
jgi:hypothetical protein